MNEIIKFSKILSKNDTGETHSHQSGISIPKSVASSGIFPSLGTDVLNPRTEVTFFDNEGKAWIFQYIYYNDVYFGKERSKSHNEFRLTCVKKFIIENGIKSGDEIWFLKDENEVCHIGFVHNKKENINENDNKTIKLSNGWRYFKI